MLKFGDFLAHVALLTHNFIKIRHCLAELQKYIQVITEGYLFSRTRCRLDQMLYSDGGRTNQRDWNPDKDETEQR